MKFQSNLLVMIKWSLNISTDVLRKKRNILLFEIFIAFSLLSLCLIPLTRIPHQYFLNKIKTLQELELARMEESVLLQMIDQKMLVNHPLQKLPTRREDALKQPYSLPSIELSLDGFSTYCYDASYILWQKQHKKGKDGNEYHVLDCEIFFSPENQSSFATKKPFRHKIFIKKTSNSD